MAAWRVLLAEDEALMAQMMTDMLSELPLEVSVAKNGREALERVQQSRPDLVLLDCVMPELDGFEVAAALKGNPATQDIPIIFMTARVRMEDKVRGLELGAEDYLIKPVRREEILARVRNVLRRSEARRAAAPPESSLMRGRLEIMGLPNLIQVLEADRRTGTLRLVSEGHRGEILFIEGRLAYAMQGPRQGEAAVYRLLGWDKGDFELELTSGVGPAEAQVVRSNLSLLMEGIRRLDEVPSLRQVLSPVEGPVTMFPMFREGLLRRTLPSGFRHLVELCDGSKTLPELLEACSLDFWGTLSFLSRFFRLGMLEHGQAAQRAFPRLGLQVSVDFQSMKSFKPARSLDLSARGMFLRTSDALPVGEDVLVRFNLPGVAHSFKAVGRVMWSSPSDTPQGVPAGMGVQFLDLDAQGQTLIERYVVELLLDRALLEESGM
ncbi:MAG TPA: TIGR02266 family protein [Candidatus Acidoferrum sp.]|nr:TIGR02266 family protein [Candidatus Acidoferrum sp.]